MINTAKTKTLPLFSKDKLTQLELLLVRRLENERWIFVQGRFLPNELPDREAVRTRFGGGKYEVIGRNKHRIIARTTFVIDGPSLPIEVEFHAKAEKQRNPSQPFATEAGQRQALVFRMLNEGLDLVDITMQTGIEARIVREIFTEWLTPLGGDSAIIDAKIATRRATIAHKSRTIIECEWEQLS